MPLNRLVKKEFFTDPKLGRLPLGARLLFQALWIQADDTGHGIADPQLLRTQAFPYDGDITAEMIDGWLRQMVDARMVSLYVVEYQSYYEVRNFLKHQVISHPSKFEYPKPEGSISTHGVVSEYSVPKSKVKVTSTIKRKKKEKEKASGNLRAADSTDGDGSFPCRDDSDVTKKTDLGCVKDVKDGDGVLRFAGLDKRRFGNGLDKYFLPTVNSVFVAYRESKHVKGECDCSPEEFVDMVIDKCKATNIIYPPGVLARLKELQRAA